MTALSPQQYNTLVDWIMNNIIPIEPIRYVYSSGTLKHAFEQTENGFYVDSECFAHVMIDCGFQAKESRSGYWYFNISKHSPAIVNYLG